MKKKGDRVHWARGARIMTGYVVEVVEPGSRPSKWPNSDNVAVRERYVVRSNGVLYYPHNESFL